MKQQQQIIGALFTSLIITGSVSSPLFAQTEENIDINPESEISQAESTGTASDLMIPARGSIQHDTFGDVHDGITQFRGFFPLSQTPGVNLLYFNGGFNVDNDGNFGGSAILGYRQYLEDMNRIFGGYFGWDNRETDYSSFDQIVMGVESLGDWDFRLNGFIPVGETRNQIFSTPVPGTVTINPNSVRFQGHNILFDTTQDIYSLYESAVTGFDLEIGTKLTDLGETGALRGYAGPYYLSPDGGGDTLGFRIRLTANPTDYLNFGLGFQTDGVFGENLLFTIGANFPGTRAEPLKNDQESVLARLGENVFRNSTILVKRQEQIDQYVESAIIGQNPETGKNWWFNHVVLEGGNSDGTAEDPYGNLEAALVDPNLPTDGNAIVYVRLPQGVTPDQVNPVLTTATQNGGTFVLPGSVRLLSFAPEQKLPVKWNNALLSSTNLGNVTLPIDLNSGLIAGSGAGFEYRPILYSPIQVETLSPSGCGDIVSCPTVVSGFEIDVSGVDFSGIEGNNGAAIQINNMDGDAIIEFNKLTAPLNGIAANITETSTGDLHIHGNEIDVNNLILTKFAKETIAPLESPTGIAFVVDGTDFTGNLEIHDNEINVNNRNPVTPNGAEGLVLATGIGIYNLGGNFTGNIEINPDVAELSDLGIIDNFDNNLALLQSSDPNFSPNTTNVSGTYITPNPSVAEGSKTASVSVVGIDLHLLDGTVTGDINIAQQNINSNGNAVSYGYSYRSNVDNNGIHFYTDNSIITGDVTISDNIITLDNTSIADANYSYKTSDPTLFNGTASDSGVNAFANAEGLAFAEGFATGGAEGFAIGINLENYNTQFDGNITISNNQIEVNNTSNATGELSLISPATATAQINGGEGFAEGFATAEGFSYNYIGSRADSEGININFDGDGEDSLSEITGDVIIANNIITINNTANTNLNITNSNSATATAIADHDNFYSYNNSNAFARSQGLTFGNNIATTNVDGIDFEGYNTLFGGNITISSNQIEQTNNTNSTVNLDSSFIADLNMKATAEGFTRAEGFTGAEGYTVTQGITSSKIQGFDVAFGDSQVTGDVAVTGNTVNITNNNNANITISLDAQSNSSAETETDNVAGAEGFSYSISLGVAEGFAVAEGEIIGIDFHSDDSLFNGSIILSDNVIDITNNQSSSIDSSITLSANIDPIDSEGQNFATAEGFAGAEGYSFIRAEGYSEIDGMHIALDSNEISGNVSVENNQVTITNNFTANSNATMSGDANTNTIADSQTTGSDSNATGFAGAEGFAYSQTRANSSIYGIGLDLNGNTITGNVTISNNQVTIDNTTNANSNSTANTSASANADSEADDNAFANAEGFAYAEGEAFARAEGNVIGIHLDSTNNTFGGIVAINQNTINITSNSNASASATPTATATAESRASGNGTETSLNDDKDNVNTNANSFSADNAEGISLFLGNPTTLSNFSISNNVILFSGNETNGDGIDVNLSTPITGTITVNTVTNAPDNSIDVNDGGNCTNVTISGNTVINGNIDGCP